MAIPNTESTARSYASLFGRASIERVVYPPVDLERFRAMRGIPKEGRVATTGRFAPEKNYEFAARVMRRVGARWDAVGNAKGPLQEDHLAALRAGAGPDMHLHVNAGEDELDRVLSGAKAYLHARPESFGIAVVEAAAAGCVPIVPDNTAHPETVPFRELRYATEDEAVSKVGRPSGEATTTSCRTLPGMSRSSLCRRSKRPCLTSSRGRDRDEATHLAWKAAVACSACAQARPPPSRLRGRNVYRPGNRCRSSSQ